MTDRNDDLSPEQQDIFDALKAGAVAKMNNDGELVGYYSHDDLPADMRECIRVARAYERALKQVPHVPGMPGVRDMSIPEAQAIEPIRDEYYKHKNTCPSCIESRGDNALMDADWWATEADHDPAPYPDGTRRSPEQASAEIYDE